MDTELKPYYVLNIYIEPTVCNSLIIAKYKKNISEVQNKVDLYKSSNLWCYPPQL